MQCVSILICLGFAALCLNFANCSKPATIYGTMCNHTSECVVYPNITQGPEYTWIPLYCNEKNSCVCPNGWIPFVGENICITNVSGSSTGETCAAYVWAISFIVVTLLTVMTYSCVSLFSRPPRLLRISRNMKIERNISPACKL